MLLTLVVLTTFAFLIVTVVAFVTVHVIAQVHCIKTATNTVLLACLNFEVLHMLTQSDSFHIVASRADTYRIVPSLADT